ncbi:hypothetical protein QAD02_003263 [Eretmocerus hayati]|uniref:Uncharacterized protein n=1 Tax=Eretmocerus hayati TaxID=131215 RepID=A0ACC2NNV7_9HYME|nr:hypothetical protein QAD02_003263 [Eretmocerus hayati]
MDTPISHAVTTQEGQASLRASQIRDPVRGQTRQSLCLSSHQCLLIWYSREVPCRKLIGPKAISTSRYGNLEMTGPNDSSRTSIPRSEPNPRSGARANKAEPLFVFASVSTDPVLLRGSVSQVDWPEGHFYFTIRKP